VRRRALAGKRRLVEDPLEDLVAPTHPAVVAHPLSGVEGGRNQACVGGELVGALESREVAHAHQELRPEDRTDAWQASEDPTLGTGEKTPSELPVEADGRRAEDLVWYYPEPIPEAAKIRGHLAFFNERVDLEVDGVEQERPKTQWS
jgi:Domain of unknown function (DUF427)